MILEKVPRKVLFVDHTASLSGGEIALLDLVTHLDARRYRPAVLLFMEGPLKRRLDEAGIETHVLPLSPSVTQASKDTLGGRSLFQIRDIAAVIGHVFRVARFISAHGIDLVHTNSLKSDVIGGVAARLARVPLIWHLRDRIDGDYLPKRVAALFRMLGRFLPNAVVANSAATLATLDLPPGKPTEVIPSGLDLSSFMANSKSDAAPRIVGIVGRIAPWKGQHIFIEAAAKVHMLFPDVRFHIAGAPLFGEKEEEYERSLRESVRKSGLENHLEFLGFRPDVAHVIGTFEIFVHASTTAEPFGQVVIQAMAAAKPVVATAGGGILEIVCDGETGILVPMGDAGAMAAAICKLLGDPALGRRLGQAGQVRAEAHFTIGRTVEKLESFYDRFLTR